MAISAATRASRVPDEDLREVIRLLILRYAANVAAQAVARITFDPVLEDWGIYASTLRPLDALRLRLVEHQDTVLRDVQSAFDKRAQQDAEASSEITPPPPGPALDLADALAALFAGPPPTPTMEAPATQD